MAANPIPAGYDTVIPYLVVRGGAKAIDFYKRAFGAVEGLRMDGPGGTIMHAELKIRDSYFMLADENEGYASPQAVGGSPVSIFVYVPDVDAVCKRAVDAGAIVKREPANQFYGDRMCTLTDPFGHIWSIATHVEDVPPEEMDRRFKAMMAEAPR